MSATEFIPTIGLEVHCQLATPTKLFCGCRIDTDGAPNSAVCPVCLGLPGALPALSPAAVQLAATVAIALDCKISARSVFSRKQYFYHDLPKGYQISQFDEPLCEGGGLTLQSGKFIALTRIHIEEDAGKSLHEQDATLIDLNRAGTALIEVVSTPTLDNADEAVEFLKKLHQLVRFVGACDGNMERGNFRCDANVSVRPRNTAQLGTRCEIKNLNSFRNIGLAINYEIDRQIELIRSGGAVVQETRLFDAATGKTRSMRSKEDSPDYRYFPEPDLRPLVLTAAQVADIKEAMPELPERARAWLTKELGVADELAETILSSPTAYRRYRSIIEAARTAKSGEIARWFVNEIAKHDLTWSARTPCALAALLDHLAENKITAKTAKDLVVRVIQDGIDPETVIAQEGLAQITSTDAVLAAVQEVIRKNPDQVAELKSGKTKVLGFLVGQIMKQGKGAFDPKVVNELLMVEAAGKP